MAVAGTGRERDSGQAVALQSARTSRRPAGFTWRGSYPRCSAPPACSFESKPGKPDPVCARKLQELLGGAYREMAVAMRYLFHGWKYRKPGKCKDLIMDIATEEMGHVEMSPP
jgi:Manganese containing catalase